MSSSVGGKKTKKKMMKMMMISSLVSSSSSSEGGAPAEGPSSSSSPTSSRAPPHPNHRRIQVPKNENRSQISVLESWDDGCVVVRIHGAGAWMWNGAAVMHPEKPSLRTQSSDVVCSPSLRFPSNPSFLDKYNGILGTVGGWRDASKNGSLFPESMRLTGEEDTSLLGVRKSFLSFPPFLLPFLRQLQMSRHLQSPFRDIRRTWKHPSEPDVMRGRRRRRHPPLKSRSRPSHPSLSHSRHHPFTHPFIHTFLYTSIPPTNPLPIGGKESGKHWKEERTGKRKRKGGENGNGKKRRKKK